MDTNLISFRPCPGLHSCSFTCLQFFLIGESKRGQIVDSGYSKIRPRSIPMLQHGLVPGTGLTEMNGPENLTIHGTERTRTQSGDYRLVSGDYELRYQL